MQPQIEPTLDLFDAQQRHIGQLIVDLRDGELLGGKFVMGPAFPMVEHMFRGFEEAVNSQALAVVDDFDTAIEALHLYLRSLDGSERISIHDVQIWQDGRMTCRLSEPAVVPGSDHFSRSSNRTIHSPCGEK